MIYMKCQATFSLQNNKNNEQMSTATILNVMGLYLLMDFMVTIAIATRQTKIRLYICTNLFEFFRLVCMIVDIFVE